MLKDSLELSMAEVKVLMRNFPSAYVGTHAEVEWLAARLVKIGLSARCEAMASID